MNRAERRRLAKQQGRGKGGKRAAAIISKEGQRQLHLGESHHQSGNLELAAQCYLKVLEENPDQPDANHFLGAIASQTGDHEGAVLLISKAIESAPNEAVYHGNLGNIFFKLGRLDEGVLCCKKALEIKPGFSDASFNLGMMLIEQGRGSEAFAVFREGLAFNRKSDPLWAGMAESLTVTTFDRLDETLFDDLLALLERPAVTPSRVVSPILSALSLDPGFADLLAEAATTMDGRKGPLDYAEAAENLSRHSLLLKLMGLSHFMSLEMEALFTALRRALLQQVMAGTEVLVGEAFSAALALHCFINEYVFFETEKEEKAIAELQVKLNELLESGGDIPSSWLLALACYRPLHQLAGGERLLNRDGSDAVRAVVRRQIAEPLEEKRLSKEIPALTDIQDGVSRSVRDQYEQNPYPRWVKAPQIPKAEPIGQVLASLRLDVDLSTQRFAERPDILIAGCGTGQHAIYTASRFLNAKVLAIDLSLNSLSYALRKTRELDISNIDYRHGDILELAGIERRFDLIESVGVLHHMDDPLAGWRVLVGLLKPAGVMKIALYSDTARQAVVRVRDFIAGQGYGATAPDIRRFRRDFIATKDDENGNTKDIINSNDFFSLSECRDLLFHVQEHRFTLLDIERALADLGLKFLGFEHDNPNVLRTFRENHPEARDFYALDKWHGFEQQNPDIFSGMYHFWCMKS